MFISSHHPHLLKLQPTNHNCTGSFFGFWRTLRLSRLRCAGYIMNESTENVIFFFVLWLRSKKEVFIFGTKVSIIAVDLLKKINFFCSHTKRSKPFHRQSFPFIARLHHSVTNIMLHGILHGRLNLNDTVCRSLSWFTQIISVPIKGHIWRYRWPCEKT